MTKPLDSNGNIAKDAKIYFDGTLTIGDKFPIGASAVQKKTLGADTFVAIFDANTGGVLQQIRFHTSCSQPIARGDQFGSLLLEDGTSVKR